MSIPQRQWHFYESDDLLTQDISKEFNISSTVSRAIINRGLKKKEDINDFLNPRLSSLKDPFEIPGMAKAVQRVLLARERKEKVLVFGDYDVDGVTGTSIIVIALKRLGFDPLYYIPHRYDEGYGMNIEAVNEFKKQGVNLIVTVDCGISNFKEIKTANELGMEVIVTDHHNIPLELPQAHAIVNPKQMPEGHPSRNLSGAGVAFKFIWAVYRKAGISDTVSVKEFLDLAALGTVADVVPLLGENRTIAVTGMKILNEKKRVGVKHLVDTAGISGRVTARNISFMLAPRLNAPGRLHHAELSMKLLLEDNPQKAQALAGEINRVNVERQQIGALIGEEIFSRMEDADEKKLILLAGKNWHPGVIGIVASRISERFNRPTILISEEGEFCRGSVRSIEGFDVYDLLLSCKDLFLDFGGHKDAAGFEMLSKDIPELEERLRKKMDGCIAIENLVPRTKIDAVIPSKDITSVLATELEQLEPYGSGNPAPVLLAKGLKIVNCKRVGQSGNHLKIKLSDGGSVFDSIGFDMGELAGELEISKEYDIAFNLSLNEWDGFEFPQMEIVDMRRPL
ncbi:MAG: single-stranded-DNA-specific exonuclease RecJ [Candidatus Saganbacteria bacterium]|nr:single-stranded-DNA-specific exonuclease RecJ [Candidatus Saganbacteria bacterium]